MRLLNSLKIPQTEWDYLLIGDGSGSVWARCGGWAVTVLRKDSEERSVLYGGCNHATNNVMELMAYVHALMFITSTEDVEKGKTAHIISDSQYVVDGVNDHTVGKANFELWRALFAFPRKGMRIKAHWVPREQLLLNSLADGIAGSARRKMEALAITVDAMPIDNYEERDCT